MGTYTVCPLDKGWASPAHEAPDMMQAITAMNSARLKMAGFLMSVMCFSLPGFKKRIHSISGNPCSCPLIVKERADPDPTGRHPIMLEVPDQSEQAKANHACRVILPASDFFGNAFDGMIIC